MTTLVWVLLVVVGVLVVVDSWLYARREDRRQEGYQPKNPVDMSTVKMPTDDLKQDPNSLVLKPVGSRETNPWTRERKREKKT